MTSSGVFNPIVNQYLDSVDEALASLPSHRRREILDDLAAHIADALANRDATDQSALEVIEELGDPLTIATAAGVGESVPSTRALDAWVPWLVLAGGFAFFVGWIVGIVGLWTSKEWKLKDKLIGTFLLPGGLLPLGVLLYKHADTTCTAHGGPGARTISNCVTTGVIHPPVLAVAVFLVALLVPLVVCLHLNRVRKSR